MMKNVLKVGIISSMLILGISHATAGVYSSSQVIESQQYQFNKQQVLSFVSNADVQSKLVELGVSPADAEKRIANMTSEELAALNTQLNDMPAGGVVGTVITVLVVVAVLDLMGLTDVYPFIRPIGR